MLLYFCQKLKEVKPPMSRNTTLLNMYERQLLFIDKKITLLHADLQYDYGLRVAELKS